MKVFPMLIKKQTFSLLNWLLWWSFCMISLVNTLKSFSALKAAHSQADPETNLPEQAQIQHRGVSQGDKVQSAWTSVSSLSSLNSTIDVGPAGDTATNTVIPNATPGTATPAIATTMTHGSTSASAYWHNMHSHVIGVPGACFGWYFSHALQGGTMQELPV
ncbi:uncharacterized protein BJ212DRAFT_1305155 [Suillus subaureus]|uniref:Uncharacterized protein n=1 Tax=Suillus subaureus TaxID=48587 RepID=A0A9P7DRA7_9AGAM|nr:uncharacterized protein BJ212DRAFT_1305155 [Suillus subaureus]KAG1801128.1 hypothetical protein BJ212DRAFT_1305155 [Suillus subaureus]